MPEDRKELRRDAEYIRAMTPSSLRTTRDDDDEETEYEKYADNEP